MKILFYTIHAPLQRIRVFDTIWDGLLTLLDAPLPKHIHIPGMYALYALRYYYHILNSGYSIHAHVYVYSTIVLNTWLA